MTVSPMLLQYANNNEPFSSPNHAAELKLDGIRLLLVKDSDIKLYTRHGNEVTTIFPELLDIPLSNGTVLDGEVILQDNQGKPDFEELMRRFKSNRDRRPVTFCAFDIIKFQGKDVTGLPHVKRKEILEQSFVEGERYAKVRLVNGNPIEYFNIIKQHGLEGIVIKDVNSKYETNVRSWAWQKVINWTYAEVLITGFRKKEFGWLTSIFTDEGKIRPTGIIELGVSPENKREFSKVKKHLVYKEDKDFVYIEPLIRCKVKTRNWTKSGMLRSPVFCEFLV